MCSVDVHSILRNSSPDVVQTFDWKDFITELEQHAPVFLTMLRGCIGPKKQPKYNEDAILGICAAILLKYQSQRMNLIQRLLSLILYSGHAEKLVSYTIV